LKKKILVAGAAAVLGTLVLSSGAVAAQHYLITSSSQIKDGTVALRDLTPFARKALKGQKGDKGERGVQGPAGPQGAPGKTVAASGPQGPKGDTGALPAGFTTSASATVSNNIVTVTPVTLTTAGFAFGPYADGGTAGGSLIYDGANGLKLNQLTALSFKAKYSTDNDTDIGVPYLRVFFKGGSNLIFSPNTQPVKDTAEDVFHTWNVLSGTVRWNDDAGETADVPFASVLADHGNETISAIKVSAGFSAGANLRVTLDTLKVNNKTFGFTS
jgi:hypothetical protein